MIFVAGVLFKLGYCYRDGGVFEDNTNFGIENNSPYAYNYQMTGVLSEFRASNYTRVNTNV